MNVFQEIAKVVDSCGEPATMDEVAAVEKQFYPFLFPNELVQLYSNFNGLNIFDESFRFESLDGALTQRDYYKKLFAEEGGIFPPALYPLFCTDNGHYLVPLSKIKVECGQVLEFAISDGDRELYALYDTIGKFVETLLKEQKIVSTNMFSGTKGHYIDEDALSNVRLELNPDAYELKQHGNYSKNGVRNIYDIFDPPSEWLQE